jgi:anthranilate phosphoribosyltransferase
MIMKETLTYLFEGNRLSREQAREVLLKVGQGGHTDIEFASLLTVYLMRPVSPEELAGFREAMLALCLHTDLSVFQPIDIVGTGGDGKNTFNISTLASFIVAGAGYKVAKHGNYAVSSTSGSSDLLEYLGYRFTNNKEDLEKKLDKAGFCFLHAPLFHPAMKYIAPTRKALKVKTFFNILGPMTNPASPACQILGVYDKQVFDLYKNVYKTSGIRYTIINSVDGYDEVSLTDTLRFASGAQEGELNPEDFGFPRINPLELFGGNHVKDAAGIFLAILSGKGSTAQNRVATANAALAIQCLEPEKKLDECIAIASESLESGKALQALKIFLQ